MRIKKVYTNYNAEREIKKLIHLKYYLRGQWMIEHRKKCLGQITGRERRQSALSAIGARLPEENHRDNNNCHIAGKVWLSGFQTLKIVKKIILQEKIIDE